MLRHGEWGGGEGFDPANISDGLWESFVENSGFAVTAAIKSVIEKSQLRKNKLQFVGSSTGGGVALEVVKRALKPSALVLSSPLPEKEYDDETSFHNNLDSFSNLSLLVLTDKDDDEVPTGETELFFNLVESSQKELVTYESGHDLPI
ncbi:MAG: hypothetical protein GY787_00255 [Alteromonadales bacterium]|nr:hypothetical protein [Alteromonadales bacterium]